MKLGIKGHSTRSNEVIKILEMLGGKDYYYLTGGDDNQFYYIYINDKYIYNSYIGPEELNGYKIFSLEEFLEKFPYKVGDKVNVWVNHEHFSGPRAELEEAEITSMRWNSGLNEVAYRLKNIIGEFYSDDMGKVNDEKNLFHATDAYEEIVENSFQGGYEKCKSDIKLNGYDLPDGYHFTDENGNVIGAKKIKLVKNSPYYPKTYEECCKVLGIDIQFCMKYLPHGTFSYKDTIIYNLQELLICRDAYWKIAGEEMELGKSWEPVWDENEDLYTIHTFNGEIRLSGTAHRNAILVFPTEEMRDAFDVNFENLIEQCKELL